MKVYVLIITPLGDIPGEPTVFETLQKAKRSGESQLLGVDDEGGPSDLLTWRQPPILPDVDGVWFADDGDTLLAVYEKEVN